MKLESIKKLCESVNSDDVILGLTYLAKRIEKYGLRDLEPRISGMRENCTALRYFKPNWEDSLTIYYISKEGFALNPTAKHYRRDDSNFIVYRTGKVEMETIKSRTSSGYLIYEE